jgi:hypothetical protein
LGGWRLGFMSQRTIQTSALTATLYLLAFAGYQSVGLQAMAQVPGDSGSGPAARIAEPLGQQSVMETGGDWSKIPSTIHPMPRPGFFPVPPTQGDAYYSLWDSLVDQRRPASPKTGYSNVGLIQYPYFDSDWRYVDGIDPEDRTWVEKLKRMRVSDRSMLSLGGNYWIRYMNENNSRLTPATNDYTLNRFRTFADWSYTDSVRVFGEYLWSDSMNEELAPLTTDVDRGDLLNLFVDVKLFEYDTKPVYIRGGRQELLYGSQRLISPLEWANTRRSFQGVKVFRQGEHWDADAFWVQPVIPQANELNQADENQNLVGAWGTYRPEKGEFIDLYYLGYNNSNRLTQAAIERMPATIHTLGSRYAGDESGWLWDFETMLQFGEQVDRELLAGAATAGLGKTWQATWSPTVWAYYDYASGDSDPNSGDAHTFNQMFPFGHYYMGWMDLVGRQNIHDLNFHGYLYPTRWITLWTQYHRFWLDQSKDAMYGPSGNVIRRDATGNSGRDVGDEIGIFANFHLSRYSDIMVSYNKLYGAGFLESTAGPGRATDADSLYLMFQQRW